MSSEGATLLVVDDNEDNRYTLTSRLKRQGYTDVATANDGRQALELLRSRPFDLVLLDIMMPELNGYQVLEQLKAHEALEKLLAAYDFRTVLDVGCGPGRHSAILRQAGKDVTGIDFVKMCDDVIVANYLHHEFDRQFDCLWLSHVVEHQVNVNQFLTKVFRDLKPGGILAVTVPPLLMVTVPTPTVLNALLVPCKARVPALTVVPPLKVPAAPA